MVSADNCPFSFSKQNLLLTKPKAAICFASWSSHPCKLDSLMEANAKNLDRFLTVKLNLLNKKTTARFKACWQMKTSACFSFLCLTPGTSKLLPLSTMPLLCRGGSRAPLPVPGGSPGLCWEHHTECSAWAEHGINSRHSLAVSVLQDSLARNVPLGRQLLPGTGVEWYQL